MNQKTLFFLDFANIDRASKDKGIRLDYGHLKDYMSFGRELVDAYCYVPQDPRNEHANDEMIESLQQVGFFVQTKMGVYSGATYKCDFDVEMTLDIIKMAHIIKPDIITVGTGDGDFIPVVNELRKMGIRVEIAAFKSNMSRKLKLAASSFIDLDIYHEETIDNSKTEECSENINLDEDTERDNSFNISNEEIDIATEIMDAENLDFYIFEQNKKYLITKDNEEIRLRSTIIQEYTNNLGDYLILYNEDYR